MVLLTASSPRPNRKRTLHDL